jgi:LEA14-like dessication related protein
MTEVTHKTKRGWLAVAIILLLLAAIGTGTWYYFFRSPDKDEHVENIIPHINVANIEITDIDGEHIKFLIKASIANTFPVNLSTKRIQYRVYIDTAMVAESSYEQPLEVRSSDSISFDIPMEASLKRMTGIFKEFKKQHTDSADYRVIAQVYVDVPVAGEQRFDVNIVKRLPAILLPELKLADTDLKKPGFKESGIDMSFIIENPNRFPIKLKDGNVKAKLDENIDLDAKIEDEEIAANSRQTVAVHFDLKTNKLGNAIWKLAFNKKNTHFNVVFTGKLDTETDILKNTNLVITANGTVDEALKAIKESK